ncbi:MAG: Type secretion system protein [Pedosphaera sp.]|nr:Type secretion system protein [Pedosphaera sp.]
MTNYSYSAVDAHGKETRGTVQVADQSEALKRIKEMGFYPIKVAELPRASLSPAARAQRHGSRLGLTSRAAGLSRPSRRVRRPRARTITLFTRQLSTLLEAGMPLLRSLRLLHEQEPNRDFKQLIASLSLAIEGGSSFSEALAQYPKIFDRLYLNMIKAGEVAGALEASLKRLADFMEKAARIKGKVKAAMFYPAAVITVATGVMALMLLVIVPRFKEVFAGLGNGRPLPAFTRFVLGISEVIQHNFLLAAVVLAALYGLFLLAIQTKTGRRLFDHFKLRMPVLGPVFRKLAIARFTRTLGTLSTSGVPILQALTIIKDATGNVVVGHFVGRVHDNVKQGESIVGPLRESNIFPAMVVGMVDVGEQTGALPEMLNKIADTYDEEVDNSVTAMTSLLEPIMIVFLGVVVGSIVIAMFLPIIQFGTDPSDFSHPGE